MTILLISSVVVIPTAAQRPDTVRPARCEIIVKLHPHAAQEAKAGRTPSFLRGLESPDIRRHVRQAKPLITDSGGRRIRPPLVGAGGKSTLVSRDHRLLRRLKRPSVEAEAADLGGIYRIELDAGAAGVIQDLLEACRRDPDVEYAELSHAISICVGANDPEYGKQWSMAKIAAPEAWDTCQGSGDVVVAVIDTGVDYNHRDIATNVWSNGAELNGLPGVDDDDNGYVDDIHGHNFAYNNADPLDDNGHGTHVAGIIAAVGNNGLDVVGVCWNAKIMPLKILDAGGDGTSADAAPAIYYAVANGADVISLSWGSDEDSQVIRDALAYARRQGVLVVAAAGNEGADMSFYPARYPGVIAVAATESNDKRWYLSNYGQWVDIAAPGRDILSLRAAGGASATGQEEFTKKLSGTSMSTPHVAGACALLLAVNPFLTGDEVEQLLLSTGDPIAVGICASNARLNVGRAMRAAVPAEGVVRFDRPSYAEGKHIGVLVTDGDLRGAGIQVVSVVTEGGDVEHVILDETAHAKGVFFGEIANERGEPRPGDRRVQAAHGERLAARYLNAYGGRTPAWRAIAYAHADYQAPTLVQQSIEVRGATARIELTTSESTRAEVRYATTSQGPFPFRASDDELSDRHGIRIVGLKRATRYWFVVALADGAGNETIVDNSGLYYSFATSGDSAGFRVPGAYPTIQAAIDDAWDGDTVWVADGTYSGEGNIEIDFGGRAITVRSENGPQACVIDCRGKGRAFGFQQGEGEDSVLDGFTITGGDAVDYGGAIRCIASSPTIRNCVLLKNSAGQYGGGLCNSYGSNPAVWNCTFQENACSSSRLSGYGGGIANMQDSSPTVEDCTFVKNSATSGGGIANVDRSVPHVIRCTFKDNFAGRFGGAAGNWDDSHPVFLHCTFSGNRARDSGAGLCNRDHSDVTLTNCILSANRADHDGGAMRAVGAVVTLTNCTISGNSAGRRYGGLVATAGGTLRLEDCIVWANTDARAQPGAEPAQLAADGGEVTIDYCCVQGLTGTLGGLGNVGSDPLFVDPDGGDYHLQSRGRRWDVGKKGWVQDGRTSPCIDAGNPGRPLGDELTTVPHDPNHSPAVNPRIDMGAYGGTAEAGLAPPGWALLADLNNDRRVDSLDLGHLAANWATAGQNRPDDLSRDGAVNGRDLAPLGSQWRHRAESTAPAGFGPMGGR